MTACRFLTTLAIALLCSAGMRKTAHAQLIGTYGGQRADGTPVSIGLSRFRGQTYITFVQVQANTVCRDGTTFDLNTFDAGLLQTVNGPNLTLSASNPTTYIGGSLVFDNATRSVSGFLFDKLSKLALAPSSGQPTKSTNLRGSASSLCRRAEPESGFRSKTHHPGL